MLKLQWKTLLIVGFLFQLGCNQPAQVKQTLSEVESKADLASIYPHTDEFKKKSHGTNFLQNATTCAKCHGKDLSGGNTQVSCQACHVHPMGWANPQKHGQHFISLTPEARSECLKCHQSEQNAESLSCANCHKGYPHKDVNGKKIRHGKIASTTEAKCFACHKQETHPQIPNSKMCSECHDGSLKVYPEVEWVEPKPTTDKPTEKTSAVQKNKRVPSSKK